MKTYPPVERLPGVDALDALFLHRVRQKVRWRRSYRDLSLTVGWHRPGSLDARVNDPVQTYEEHGRVQVACWCEAGYAWVPIDEVRRGVTRSCRRVNCRETIPVMSR